MVDEDQIKDKEDLDASHADPKNWRWGVFYYNKKDKRIFPPKRMAAFGWTVNFANPGSVLPLAVLIAMALTEMGWALYHYGFGK